ncbi:T9SS type A sorting domain-containing protein [Flavobacterium sp.]|uniref:T9SS type A sorting domain-containing protein n=1 Tax=Flavobacterium sp. TaxID=239 RepID=UPI0039E65DE9
MIEKITKSTKSCRLFLASALAFSGLNFAQTTSRSPIYDRHENELIQKRDLFSKHFLNQDGSYTAAIASGPIHYEHSGVFSDIDNTIRPAAVSGYAHANIENLMESYFGTTAHHGVKNKTKEGEVSEFLETAIHWEVDGLKVNERQSANVAFTAQDNKGYYNGLYEAINAEFVVLNGKRKLNYILTHTNAIADAPANASYFVFTEKVKMPANWSYLNTENGLLIQDDKQQPIYLYGNPFSYDATGIKLRCDNTLMTVSAQGNTLTIATKIKANWLLSPDRVFPITVDPTVTVYPTAANYHTGSVFSSDYLKETATIGFGRFNDNNGVEDFLRGWARFNTASLPEDAVIANGVTVNFYISGGSEDYAPANGHELVFSKLTLDPVTATGATLYDAIGQFGYGPFVTAAINSIGWKAHTLTSVTLQSDIASSLAANYFSIGFMPQGDFFAGEYLIADGWDANDPYLTFTYTQPLGVTGFSQSAIKLYPNPVENKLHVDTDYEIESINLYSVFGQLVQFSANQNTIDISALASGIYSVEIKGQNQQTATRKIVKR